MKIIRSSIERNFVGHRSNGCVVNNVRKIGVGIVTHRHIPMKHVDNTKKINHNSINGRKSVDRTINNEMHNVARNVRSTSRKSTDVIICIAQNVTRNFVIVAVQEWDCHFILDMMRNIQSSVVNINYFPSDLFYVGLFGVRYLQELLF